MLSVTVRTVSNHHAVQAPRVLIGDTCPCLMLRLHSQGESVLEKGKIMANLDNFYMDSVADAVESYIIGTRDVDNFNKLLLDLRVAMYNEVYAELDPRVFNRCMTVIHQFVGDLT